MNFTNKTLAERRLTAVIISSLEGLIFFPAYLVDGSNKIWTDNQIFFCSRQLDISSG